jgi:hypothetical protein
MIFKQPCGWCITSEESERVDGGIDAEAGLGSSRHVTGVTARRGVAGG